MSLRVLIGVLLLLGLMLSGGCEREQEPIRVGFVGTLSGRVSDLSVSGREGATLAVEQFNAGGGLEGRPVHLLSRDDGHNRAEARQAVSGLIDDEVVAIIGHMTSSMSRATISLINNEEMLMISPTTSTSYLAGRDDFFLRVYPSHQEQIDLLSRYIFQEKGVENMVGVYDLSNHEYTVDWYTSFRRFFNEQGGTILHSAAFTSGTDFSHEEVLQRILSPEAEGILILAGGGDTARLVQALRLLDSDLPVFTGAWAKTRELIAQGGTGVEGLAVAHFFDSDSEQEDYQNFRREYLDRFGHEPDFGALFSYEATRVLLWALENTDDWSGSGLREIIIGEGHFSGLQGDFFIDRFGDCVREAHIFQVRDGAYQRVDF